jgi:hypothetical protein
MLHRSAADSSLIFWVLPFVVLSSQTLHSPEDGGSGPFEA